MRNTRSHSQRRYAFAVPSSIRLRAAAVWVGVLAFAVGIVLASGGGARAVGIFSGGSASSECSGSIMGTTFSVKFSHDGDASRIPLAQTVIARMERIDELMSTYKPDSELSRFNALASDEWFPVSEETARTVREAIETGRKTDGAFDVTVGPLVRLWKFGPSADGRAASLLEAEVPDREAIDRAREQTGLDNLEVRMSPPALRKKVPELDVDLSGIAKGAAVDAAAEELDAHGITDYMVEIGGEVRARGRNIEGRPWQIGIESPVAGAREIGRVVPLDGLAIATSGDYRNYFEREGKRYSHIIDPRTGQPIDHRLASVSVLAPRCSEADSLATAMMVLGTAAAFDFAERQDVAALLIFRDPDSGTFRERTTPRFEELMAAATDGASPNMFLVFGLTVAVFVVAFLALIWGQWRGRPRPHCEHAEAKRLMQTFEAKDKAKRQLEGRGGTHDLPILPPEK